MFERYLLFTYYVLGEGPLQLYAQGRRGIDVIMYTSGALHTCLSSRGDLPLLVPSSKINSDQAMTRFPPWKYRFRPVNRVV